MMFIFWAALIFVLLSIWGIVGVLVVVWLNLFGRRYDYEEDYPLTEFQTFLAGPLVWFMWFIGRRKK